jgi:hypothetical protein
MVIPVLNLARLWLVSVYVRASPDMSPYWQAGNEESGVAPWAWLF